MTARPLKLHLRCALVPTLEAPAPGIRPMAALRAGLQPGAAAK